MRDDPALLFSECNGHRHRSHCRLYYRVFGLFNLDYASSRR
jgi:hypothetical protein